MRYTKQHIHPQSEITHFQQKLHCQPGFRNYNLFAFYFILSLLLDQSFGRSHALYVLAALVIDAIQIALEMPKPY